MSKASGLVLVFAGLGVAAYMIPSIPSDDEKTEVTQPQQTEVAKSTASTAQGNQSLAGLRQAGRVVERPSTPAPAPQPTYKPAAVSPVAAAVEPSSTRSAPVVVTVPKRPSEPAARVAVGQMQPSAGPVDRAALARELQKELRRVGCYGGEINGTWTPTTRQAMKAFTDRVNATLPIEAPDYILLAMVQNHSDKVCGKPCPAGQALTEDGRCLPNAIIAKKASPPAVAVAAPIVKAAPAPTISGWTTTATAVAPIPSLPSPPLDGRMALSGPKAQPKADDGAHLVAVNPGEEQPAGGPAADLRAPADQAAAQRPRRSGAPARRANPAESAPRRPAFGPSFFGRSDRSSM